MLIEACCAISYLSHNSNDKLQGVIDSGVCPRLVDLLSHPSTSVQTRALRSIGNIASGDDTQAQVIIESGALPVLLSLLSSPTDHIRRETCWTISNITAGTSAQVQAVIDANIIPSLIDALHDSELKTRREACLAISNMTNRGLEIQNLVSHGCIEVLCGLLTTVNSVTHVALNVLDNILGAGLVDQKAAGAAAIPNIYALRVEEAGGVASINNLRWDSDHNISEKAFAIVEIYFPHANGIIAPSLGDRGVLEVRVVPLLFLLYCLIILPVHSRRWSCIDWWILTWTVVVEFLA